MEVGLDTPAAKASVIDTRGSRVRGEATPLQSVGVLIQDDEREIFAKQVERIGIENDEPIGLAQVALGTGEALLQVAVLRHVIDDVIKEQSQLKTSFRLRLGTEPDRREVSGVHSQEAYSAAEFLSCLGQHLWRDI